MQHAGIHDDNGKIDSINNIVEHIYLFSLSRY